MTPSALLLKAADLIEPPGAWTQGEDARDAHGLSTSARSPYAVCWCAGGAIAKVAGATGGATVWDAMGFLRKAAWARNIAIWNDTSGRTQAEVVAALRQAAELAGQGAG